MPTARHAFVFPKSSKLLIILTVTSLSGCSLWSRYLAATNTQSLVSALPLKVSDPRTPEGQKLKDFAGQPNSAAELDFLGQVAMDSEAKCMSFFNGLVVAENSVNTYGDVGATVLSAAATVFTPLTTVHALTAGATVITGAKTSVVSNIYAKASVANFQAALEKTYFKSMNDYVSNLPELTHYTVSAEVFKIESIHATCSLAAAENSIAATIAGPAGVPEKPIGVTATPYDGAVLLTWPSVDGATAYNIYRGTAKNGESSTPVKSVTGTSYVDTVTNGSTYYYKIEAQNSAGKSPMSAEVSATPAAGQGNPPPQPPPTKAVVPGSPIAS